MHSSNEKTLTERIEQRRQARTLPRFIAVEGPIGAGKTSLAKRL
ncbi:MAG TPA: deoxynucleoside kinase, partial [Alcanivorax sp.]|nr:deoxynucleoside kinase [Alcanivorax sp.]